MTEARSRLDPAAGVMLSALWVGPSGQLLMIVHHLAVDGVSWRILLEDFNLAWAQHRGGQQVELPAPRTSFARWASVLAEQAYHPQVVKHAERVAADRGGAGARCRRCDPESDTYANAGSLSVELDVETTRMLLGEVPAAFHAGINDILLIAFGLALDEFLGTAGSPIVIDAEGHGRQEELASDVETIDLSRTVGWFTTKYPVALAVGGLDWGAGARRRCGLGPDHQGRQGTASGPAGRVDLRSAALPQQRCRSGRRRPDDRVQLSGPDGCRCGQVSGDFWGIREDGWEVTGVAAAVPMPLMHTVELNAGTVDTDAGPRLRAGWMWATSALDHAQVDPVERVVV